jgi:hypothetical protein
MFVTATPTYTTLPHRVVFSVKKLIICIAASSVWRPINHPVEDMPLAVCDGSTVRQGDLVETDHVRSSYIGSTMYLIDDERHRWHYVSKQTPDEVLVFKNFDSASDVAARCKSNTQPVMMHGVYDYVRHNF